MDPLRSGFVSMMLSRLASYVVNIILCVLLMACSDKSLPEYWVCRGSTQQQVKYAGKDVTQKYMGTETMMLEIFGNQLTKYISKPFTGVYYICKNSELTLAFNSRPCGELKQLASDWKISAILDKTTGNLSINESRTLADVSIEGEGLLHCRYFGNEFPSTIFY